MVSGVFPNGVATSDDDDYDLDLVCELDDHDNVSADKLKNGIVKPWLTNYKKPKTELEEKRCCWHVEYEDVPSFHMDVIPAMHHFDGMSGIRITNKNEASRQYSFQDSNPKGYIDWFYGTCRKKKQGAITRSITEHNVTDQEDLKRNKNRTILQKSIQILKRHRDIMFENNSEDKPVSIIITTLMGNLYDGEETILETITNFANSVEVYLLSNKKADHYSIPNPSLESEDFANKWIEHPERQEAFFAWIRQVKIDFDVVNLVQYSQ